MDGPGGVPRPLDATAADADIKAMITTTEAWRVGWRVGAAVVVALPFYVSGGPMCPPDPYPCHSPLDVVPPIALA